MKAQSLKKAITDAVIRRLAGEAGFTRGEDLFRRGLARLKSATEQTAEVSVSGFEVALASDEGILDYGCTCEEGEAGKFCQHVAAAALLVKLGKEAAKQKKTKKSISLADAREVLLEYPQEELVAKLIAWAEDDVLLRDRLLLETAKRQAPDGGAEMALKQFEAVAKTRKVLQGKEAKEWTQKVYAAIHTFEMLLESGYAARLQHPLVKAFEILDKQIDRVYSSDRTAENPLFMVDRLHLRACREAPELATHLPAYFFNWRIGFKVIQHKETLKSFGFELDEEMEAERRSLLEVGDEYWRLLGPKGQDEYRAIVKREFEKVTSYEAGYALPHADHVTLMAEMEKIAEDSGDVDELIRVVSRDLSTTLRFHKLVEICMKAGREDEALKWARRGIEEMPVNRTEQLARLVYELLAKREAWGESFELARSGFILHPTWESFQLARQYAERSKQPATWEDEIFDAAVKHVDNRAKPPLRGSPGWSDQMRWDQPPNYVPIVNVLLEAQRPLQALQVARRGEVDPSLWLRITRQIGMTDAKLAESLYAGQAESMLSRPYTTHVRGAIDLLLEGLLFCREKGRGREFQARIELLMRKYAHKENFAGRMRAKLQQVE